MLFASRIVIAPSKDSRRSMWVVAEWREHVAGTLKPSTKKSAESHLRRHIEHRERNIVCPKGLHASGNYDA